MWSPNWPPSSHSADLADPAGLIPLGSGRSGPLRIAAKAAMLDRARRAGLPVPDGVVVSGDLADAELAAAIDLWRSAAPRTATYAVRSAFGAEDGVTSTRAGWFLTELDRSADDVVESIRRVRASVDRLPADQRRDVRPDVLIMEMVRAERAGVAFSEPGTYDDVVNVVGGLADRLVSGQEAGERLLLPRLERPDEPWRHRLRSLLAAVRDVVGDEPWDIEWADDGATCWLVQIRPITAPPIRKELLTLANHAEILPELPSTLMTSVIEHAGPDLFAWYRRRVPGLPADRDFLHVVAGRPMINLSLLEDMMRHLGLPTALVSSSIGGEFGADLPAAPTRMLRRSPSLVRLGLAQLTAVARARSRERRVAAIGSDGASSFAAALDQLHDAYVTLVTGMFPLSSAIGPPLAVLRRAGTLADHAGTHRTITTELAERLAELRSTSTDRRAAPLERFLSDFGHRGVYESDVAWPRFADEPDLVVSDQPPRCLPEDPTRRTASARRGIRWWATRPLWWVAARPLAARERYRHEAMRSFASIRDSLMRLSVRAAAAGQLPTPDDLWLLDVDAARSLDRGVRIDPAQIAALRQERHRLAELRPPHVVDRHADPDSWRDEDDGRDRWSGLPLTTGRVEGRAWVLREPSDRLPDGFDRATTILVARSIDAGWVGTLDSVAGAAVEIGGDLSHGSILVRELGLPAITNARGLTAALETGDHVVLDAGGGELRRDR